MRFFMFLSLTLSVAVAEAMWLALDDAALLAQSDLVVDGRFIGHTGLSVAGRDLRLGVLAVERLHRGAATEALILLELPPIRKGYAVSTDIDFEPGQQGLWLLRKADAEGLDGLFAADHPQRFAAKGSEDYRRLDKLIRGDM